MAILGTQQDFAQRLAGLLPAGWYPAAQVGDGTNPVLDATLLAAGGALAQLWTLLTYVQTQTRLGTATEANLDVIARDFLGSEIVRKASESDDEFRGRIRQAIFAPRVTREALSQNIEALTGTKPTIVIPSSANDTGAWDTPHTAWDVGLWGSEDMPRDVFVTVTLPPGGGVPNVMGWDVGAWDTPETAWTDDSMAVVGISEQDVYDVINRTRPVNVRVWVRFGPQPNSSIDIAGSFDNSFSSDFA